MAAALLIRGAAKRILGDAEQPPAPSQKNTVWSARQRDNDENRADRDKNLQRLGAVHGQYQDIERDLECQVGKGVQQGLLQPGPLRPVQSPEYPVPVNAIGSADQQ